MEAAPVVITEEGERVELIPAPRPSAVDRPDFAELWANAYDGADEQLHRVWDRLRDEWLRMKETKSKSRHTRRSYETASAAWLDFLATQRHADGRTVRAWQATSGHVRTWREHLAQQGLAESSINQRLAACSSFYSFVIRERYLVNGMEVSAFMDAKLQTRSNPFHGNNVQRGRVQRYGKARILTAIETAALLDHLNANIETLRGARNHALLLCYLLTGYRNYEVVRMVWSDIEANPSQPGSYLYRWQGKGGKAQRDAFPARVYHAIAHYLRLAGRLETMHSGDYVFLPMATHNAGNLNNIKEVTGNKHISEASALRILRTVLKNAGIKNPEKVRIHDLRHTFAQRFRVKNGDLEALRERLHHESLATTGIYAREILDTPKDDWSESVYQGLLGL